MASNINQAFVIILIASLLALFSHVDSTFISEAPGPAPELPVDAKTEMTWFIQSAMTIGRHKVEKYIKAIEEQVKDPAISGSNLECLNECKEVYEAALDDMRNTIEDVESGDFYKAGVDMSAVSTYADTCRECYMEMSGEEEDPEAKNFDKWVMGITGDCLEKLGTFTS